MLFLHSRLAAAMLLMLAATTAMHSMPQFSRVAIVLPSQSKDRQFLRSSIRSPDGLPEHLNNSKGDSNQAERKKSSSSAVGFLTGRGGAMAMLIAAYLCIVNAGSPNAVNRVRVWHWHSYLSSVTVLRKGLYHQLKPELQ